MAQVNKYNSNNLPHSIPGGVVLFKNADGSAIADSTAGIRTVEDINLDREAPYIERKGPYGGAGGFAIAGKANAKSAALKQIKGSTVVQVPTENDADFVDVGQYCELPYRGKTYRCVIRKVGDSFKTEQYWAQRCDVSVDHYVDPANPID